MGNSRFLSISSWSLVTALGLPPDPQKNCLASTQIRTGHQIDWAFKVGIPPANAWDNESWRSQAWPMNSLSGLSLQCTQCTTGVWPTAEQDDLSVHLLLAITVTVRWARSDHPYGVQAVQHLRKCPSTYDELCHLGFNYISILGCIGHPFSLGNLSLICVESHSVCNVSGSLPRGIIVRWQRQMKKVGNFGFFFSCSSAYVHPAWCAGEFVPVFRPMLI